MSYASTSSLLLKQSFPYTRLFYMTASSDHLTPLTGATPAVNLSKAGAAFAAAAGAITEISNGWYKIALTAVDTGTPGDLAYRITATSGDPLNWTDQVNTTIFTDVAVDANGNVAVASSVKRNTALNGFTFVMTDVNGNPKTGLTVTAQRTLGAGGFAPCANSPTELSNGVYAINLASTDLNSPTIMLLFTAPNAINRFIPLLTQP